MPWAGRAQITHVSADAAGWIADVVAGARMRFNARSVYVVAWVPGARRRAAPSLERRTGDRTGQVAGAGPAKRRTTSGRRRARRLRAPATRCGKIWTSPGAKASKLAWTKTDPHLYRFSTCSKSLRHVFPVRSEEGKQALDPVVSGQRCRIPVFDIKRHRVAIDAPLDRIPGLIESTNTSRLLTGSLVPLT